MRGIRGAFWGPMHDSRQGCRRSSYLYRRSFEVKDQGRRRVFIFYPAINTRDWRVLAGSVSETFASEWLAVEFALGLADKLGGARMVDVLRETISGGWMPVPQPAR